VSELAGAELQRALAGLRDIHLPLAEAAPSPGLVEALGRPWVGALLLAVLGVTALVLWHRRRQAPRRRRLQEIAGLAAAHAGDGNTPLLLAGLGRLLRAQAVLRHGQGAAALTGDAWLRWLDEHGPAKAGAAFSCGVGRVLLDGAFRPPGAALAVDRGALLALVTGWLEHNA
jgi:hypothetical protein